MEHGGLNRRGIISWNPDGADWLCMRQRGELEAIMLHRYLSEDTHEERPLSDATIIMGLVAVCVFLALILLGAGMLDTREKSTTQPPSTTQSEGQAPAITQPSAQAPATGETNAIQNPH